MKKARKFWQYWQDFNKLCSYTAHNKVFGNLPTRYCEDIGENSNFCG